MDEPTSLRKIAGVWYYRGVAYPRPIPENSAVSFAIARCSLSKAFNYQVKPPNAK